MSAIATTYPFAHYQLFALNESQSPIPSAASTILPVNGHTCLFALGNYSGITHIVYNIYLYTEEDVLIESFAHEFKRTMVVRRNRLGVRNSAIPQPHNMMVTRAVEDAFPTARGLSTAVKRLTIWQFSDDI